MGGCLLKLKTCCLLFFRGGGRVIFCFCENQTLAILLAASSSVDYGTPVLLPICPPIMYSSALIAT